MWLDVGYIFPTEQDLAGRSALQPRNHPQGCGLATARRAKQGEELPGRNLEVEIIDRNKAGELLTNT